MLPLNCPACRACLSEPPLTPTGQSSHVFVGVEVCETCGALVRVMSKGDVVLITVIENGLPTPLPWAPDEAQSTP